MTCEALGWAMETDRARAPVERLILIGIGNGADAFGVAMTDRERLRALAAASPDELEEAMTGLVERRVLALVPALGKLDRAEVGGPGLRRPQSALYAVLTGWEARARLAPGDVHPLLGEVTLR